MFNINQISIDETIRKIYPKFGYVRVFSSIFRL